MLLNWMLPLYNTAEATGGAPAPTAAPPAAPPAEAPPPSSFLGNAMSEAPPPEPTAPNDTTTADGITREVIDGPPEFVPEKFWDKETKQVRVEDLAKGYSDLEKLLGTEKIPVPQSAEDTEGWDRWYKANGRPDEAAGYELEKQTIPQGLEYDSSLEDAFLQTAFANGLNPKQAQAFYDMFVGRQVELFSGYEEARQQQAAQLQNSLEAKYGNALQNKKAQAGLALSRYGSQDFMAMLEETGLGNDPRMIEFAIKVGEELGGETRLVGRPERDAEPADIQKAISEFRTKNAKALYDGQHPDHERIVQELYNLNKKLYGDQAVTTG